MDWPLQKRCPRGSTGLPRLLQVKAQVSTAHRKVKKQKYIEVEIGSIFGHFYSKQKDIFFPYRLGYLQECLFQQLNRVLKYIIHLLKIPTSRAPNAGMQGRWLLFRAGFSSSTGTAMETDAPLPITGCILKKFKVMGEGGTDE